MKEERMLISYSICATKINRPYSERNNFLCILGDLYFHNFAAGSCIFMQLYLCS